MINILTIDEFVQHDCICNRQKFILDMVYIHLRVLKWLPLNFTDVKSLLVRVMTWYLQARNQHFRQCWPRPISPYDVTRLQWLNATLSIGMLGVMSETIVYPCYQTQRNGTSDLSLQYFARRARETCSVSWLLLFELYNQVIGANIFIVKSAYEFICEGCQLPLPLNAVKEYIYEYTYTYIYPKKWKHRCLKCQLR